LVHATSNVVWIILPKHLASKVSNLSQRSVSSLRPSYLKIIVIIGWISNWSIIRIDPKKQSSTWSCMLKFSWFFPLEFFSYGIMHIHPPIILTLYVVKCYPFNFWNWRRWVIRALHECPIFQITPWPTNMPKMSFYD
jgi:hypothetical protein